VVLVALALVAAGCAWDRPRSDAGNTGANPLEVTIGTGNVGSLVFDHRTDAAAPPSGTVSIDTVPTVLVHGDTMFVSGNDEPIGGFRAFPTDGADPTCGGSPRECPRRFEAASERVPLELVGGTLFTHAFAFDPSGTESCTGSPRRCTPRWTEQYSPTTRAYDGPIPLHELHLTGFVNPPSQPVGFRLAGFDPKGVEGCGGVPKTCAPLWNVPVGNGFGEPAPAAADGRVFALSTAGDQLVAYDRTATAQWTAPLPHGAARVEAIVVAGKQVIVVALGAQGGRSLRAYDTAGVVNCSGPPKSCGPLWTTDTLDGDVRSPAVTGDRMYVTTGTTLRAYDVDGNESCALTNPRLCVPLWIASTGPGNANAPSVANGVVYTTSDTGSVRAFDAAGSVGCGGVPRTCNALWSKDLGVEAGAPAISNGRLFVPVEDGRVQVFRPAG
jgi:outer membrane protein assembly factor BamB